MKAGLILSTEAWAMHKWTFFASGILAGVVAVVLTASALQGRGQQAWAAPAFQGTDNTGHGIALTTGGSQQGIQDVLWVIYKRHAVAKAGEGKEGALVKEERITLCCYQIANGARSMKFVAARDITFDLDVIEFQNDKPKVKDIVEEIKKTMKQDK
jgi:hypothetical protein